MVRDRGRTSIRSNCASRRILGKASKPLAKHSAREVADRITEKHSASWGRVYPPMAPKRSRRKVTPRNVFSVTSRWPTQLRKKDAL